LNESSKLSTSSTSIQPSGELWNSKSNRKIQNSGEHRVFESCHKVQNSGELDRLPSAGSRTLPIQAENNSPTRSSAGDLLGKAFHKDNERNKNNNSLLKCSNEPLGENVNRNTSNNNANKRSRSNITNSKKKKAKKVSFDIASNYNSKVIHSNVESDICEPDHDANELTNINRKYNKDVLVSQSINNDFLEGNLKDYKYLEGKIHRDDKDFQRYLNVRIIYLEKEHYS